MLNHLDKDFAKLKVKGYDKNGNEIIAKLSDVAPSIDLAQLIKADITNYGEELIKHNRIDESKIDYRLTNNASNPFTKFRPEFRYEKINDDELENFFATYADKDGWVDLSKHHREIFNESSVFSNFAYTKIDMNGNVVLSEFNPILSNKKMDKNFSYSFALSRRATKF